jgi:hypothetical protein
MATIEFAEDDIKDYLDRCIVHWRDRLKEGYSPSVYYIDAFQSMRMSIFGETLAWEMSIINNEVQIDDICKERG